jgi:Fur family ferric uptake transcriptional regulator
MTDVKKEALQNIRKKGMRLTSLRKQLVNFILSQAGHWTIQDLTQKTKKAVPGVGVATVYRTVNLLVEEGALTKTLTSQGSARYETRPDEHHDHLTCLQCGEIFEFTDPKIEELQEKIAKRLGFVLIDHRMELFGECKDGRCKTRKKTPK